MYKTVACLNAASTTPASPTFFPLTNDNEEEWWNSIPTVSGK